MSENKISRRDAARRTLMILGAVAVAPSALAACGGGGATCTDTSGLSAVDSAARTTNNYQEASGDPNKKCSICRFFTVGQPATGCGTCQVIRGPINPDGSCNLFNART